MCGRFTQLWKWKQLQRLAEPFWEFGERDEPAPSRYNLPPSQVGLVIARGGADHGAEDGIALRSMRWGFTRMKGGAAAGQVINARIETAHSLPMFRDAMAARRCLVPASGFFEWEKLGDGSKQAWYLVNAEAPLFFLAGLWSPDAGRDGKSDGNSVGGGVFVVLTADTPAGFAPAIHHRMPGIVMPEDAGEWLSPELTDGKLAKGLVRAFGAPGAFTTQAWGVSRRVNSPANDDPTLIEPVEPERGLF
ncbi:MAG: SOS response-associated peptidase [Phycisphaerales bacterium]